MAKYPQLADKEWLLGQYETLGRSSIEIAAEVGCSPATVILWLRKFDISVRGRWYGRWKPKVCERCSAEFVPSGPAQRFCSTRCQAGTGVCEWCGGEFVKTAPQKRGVAVYPRRFCSRDCQSAWRAKNSRYRYVNSEGYVVVVVGRRPPTMRRSTTAQGYVRVSIGGGKRVLEHRLVMEESLGRPLLPHETVHHINGNKSDNRLENLQLRQGRHGKGAHFVCLDCGSHNVEAANL